MNGLPGRRAAIRFDSWPEREPSRIRLLPAPSPGEDVMLPGRALLITDLDVVCVNSIVWALNAAPPLDDWDAALRAMEPVLWVHATGNFGNGMQVGHWHSTYGAYVRPGWQLLPSGGGAIARGFWIDPDDAPEAWVPQDTLLAPLRTEGMTTSLVDAALGALGAPDLGVVAPDGIVTGNIDPGVLGPVGWDTKE